MADWHVIRFDDGGERSIGAYETSPQAIATARKLGRCHVVGIRWCGCLTDLYARRSAKLEADPFFLPADRASTILVLRARCEHHRAKSVSTFVGAHSPHPVKGERVLVVDGFDRRPEGTVLATTGWRYGALVAVDGERRARWIDRAALIRVAHARLLEDLQTRRAAQRVA